MRLAVLLLFMSASLSEFTLMCRLRWWRTGLLEWSMTIGFAVLLSCIP